MKSALDESKVENGAEARAGCTATCCGHDAREVAKRIEKGVNDAKAAVSATLEDGRIAAERLFSETAHKIKRRPLGSFAIAFAAGAALGFLVPRSIKK